jgi:hypothetical protein
MKVIYEIYPDSNVALVASHNVTFGYMRMYYSICEKAENGERNIFKNLSQAEGCLPCPLSYKGC